MIHVIFYFRSNSIVHSLNYPGKRLHCLTQIIFFWNWVLQSTRGTMCSFWLQIGPLLSWFNARWHFKSINWDGRQTSLNVAVLPRLESGEKRKIHPSCNLAPSSSPLWQGGSDKSSFSAWAIRKRQERGGAQQRGRSQNIQLENLLCGRPQGWAS